MLKIPVSMIAPDDLTNACMGASALIYDHINHQRTALMKPPAGLLESLVCQSGATSSENEGGDVDIECVQDYVYRMLDETLDQNKKFSLEKPTISSLHHLFILTKKVAMAIY